MGALRRLRPLLASVLALGALAAAAPPAGAHANLVRAVPEPGATVDQAPQVVYAEFSEAIDLSFSRLEVLDASGAEVTAGPTERDPTGPNAMLVPVAPLANGAYVVVWRTLSVVDGHVIRGSYAFGVGAPVAPELAAAASTVESSPTAAVSRSLLFVGAAVLVGAPLQALTQRRGAARRWRDVFERRLGFLILGAGLLALAGQVGLLGAQAAARGGGSLLAGIPDAVGDGQWGGLWIVRTAALICALAAAAQIAAAAASARRRALGLGVVLAAGAAASVSVSRGSHAAALVDAAPALLADVIHLLAVGAWVGGLPALLLAAAAAARAPDAPRPPLAEIAARFSAVATVAVGLIVVTGAYSAWIQVLEPPRLWSTPYGRLLLVKVSLVLPLLALGGVNMLWTRRRLARAGAESARPRRALRVLVAAEIVLAAAVLGVVGFLTEREPARQVASAAPVGVEAVGSSGGAVVRIRAVPGRPGPNRLDLDLQLPRGLSTHQAAVELQLRYLDRDLGTVMEWPARTSEGRFTVDTDALTLAGGWRALAIVRRAGMFDARVPLRVDIGSAGGSGGAAVDAGAAARIWGLVVAGMGLTLAAATLARAGWWPPLRRAGAAAGFAAIGAGALILMLAPDTRTGAVVNPIPPDGQSIAAGGALFAAECVTCHGDAGRGDGPLAAELDPPPLDLTVHVPLHPDSELFAFIAQGIEGTAMPAFGQRLADADVWNLVNYIQTLPAAARP